MMYLNQVILLQKSVGKDSVIELIINISKSNPLAGSSYIKLPKELDLPRKSLIYIQNFDGKKCFK